MRKKLLAAGLIMMMGIAATGCGQSGNKSDASKGEATQNQTSTETVAAKYVTVTEAEDWGPAITKVVLKVGKTVDAASLSTDSFSVSSERKYTTMDPTTYESVDMDDVKERQVTAVYPSDEKGNQDTSGTCIAIEMQIGPDMTEGSPFNYDFVSGLNYYVDTAYKISMKDGAEIKAADGTGLVFEAIDGTANDGNVNVIADDFDLTGSYTTEDGKITLKYASYVPAENAEKGSTPLIIWLHGAGEGGTDPTISIMGNKVVNLATDEIQGFFGETGAQILAPQTPTMWMDNGKGEYSTPQNSKDGKSYYTEALKSLMDKYISEHPEIDTNRIYIGGCSNGGYMTMNMITNYPGFFAAAYPVCEAYSKEWLTDEKVAAIKDLPIWFTSAKTDGTVKIFEGENAADYVTYNLKLDDKGEAIPIDDFTNAAYDKVVAAGNKNAHYTLFENVKDATGKYNKEDGTPYEYMGHWSWIYTLNNECVETINGKEVSIFEWLSQQSK